MKYSKDLRKYKCVSAMIHSSQIKLSKGFPKDLEDNSVEAYLPSTYKTLGSTPYTKIKKLSFLNVSWNSCVMENRPKPWHGDYI